MRVQIRGINRGEQFACSVRELRQAMEPPLQDLSVSFGHTWRDYTRDRTDRNHPAIQGTIVASASVNFRKLHGPSVPREPGSYLLAETCYVSFYVIRDAAYTPRHRALFVEEHLPGLCRWCKEIRQRPQTQPEGVERLLIEWRRGELLTHRYRSR